ncbi:MAG: hypothetical protein ACRYFW_11245 [Janthinobacterium lividum]
MIRAAALVAMPAAPAQSLARHRLRPSTIDPGPRIASVDRGASPDAPLVPFLAGTGGEPASTTTIRSVMP